MHSHRAFFSAFAMFFAVAALVLTAVPAHATGNFAARVDGSFSDGAGEGVFEGTLTLTGFEQRGDGLVALGTLDGSFTDGAGKKLGELDGQSLTLPIEGSTLAASCERASMTLRLEDVDGAGVRAHLQPVEVEIDASAVPKGRLQEPLCELGKLVKGSAGAGAVAQGLGRVLAALE
jgi:hypothetical protein